MLLVQQTSLSAQMAHVQKHGTAAFAMTYAMGNAVQRRSAPTVLVLGDVAPVVSASTCSKNAQSAHQLTGNVTMVCVYM